MQCEVCREPVEMTEGHFVSDCGHAYHSRCLGNGWKLPGCLTCRSSTARRGDYIVDLGKSASEHMVRAAHPPPPKSYFFTQHPALKCVTRVAAKRAPLPSFEDILSSGATFDMFREAGVTVADLMSCGMTEEFLIHIGYELAHVDAGDVLPEGNIYLKRRRAVDAGLTHLLQSGLKF